MGDRHRHPGLWQRPTGVLQRILVQPKYKQAFPEISDDDLFRWNGGGCTETMLAGISHVGSIDWGLNVLWVLEKAMYENLQSANSFEDFWDSFSAHIREGIRNAVGLCNAKHQTVAKYMPQPVRSLFIEDCLEQGLDFNQPQAARYNWSVFGIAGLTNAGNSLYAIHELIFNQQRLSATELLNLLKTDFAANPLWQEQLKALPKFGNDHDEVDAIVAKTAAVVADELQQYTPWRGGLFVPSVIMFATYGRMGEVVGATPDGRSNGDPIADSIGAATGQDKLGPTALLNSVSKLPLHRFWGTPVLNLRLSGDIPKTLAGRRSIRALLEGFFQEGGMQVQVTMVDAALLRKAKHDPALAQNLIVRIGGYSEYFSNLNMVLREEVIQRSEHQM